MIELKNEKIAVPLVLFAGILWSFGPLVVRYMSDPHLVPWQYIFGRGLTIFIILNLYLYFEEGINFYKNYKKIGKSGLLGGAGLDVFQNEPNVPKELLTMENVLLTPHTGGETRRYEDNVLDIGIVLPIDVVLPLVCANS